MDARCQVKLFGQLRVTQGEQCITRFRDRKTAALFAYLVYFRRHPHPREELAYLFWPDDDNRLGRASLSTALNALHKQLEPPGTSRGTVLRIDRYDIQCNPDTCTTDVTAFETVLRQAAYPQDKRERLPLLLAAAAELYTGDLLPGFYDDWILTERIRLQTAYLRTLSSIAVAQENARELQLAVETAQRIVATDPLHEEAHLTLIRLYAALGDIAASRRQSRTLALLLQKENGNTPTRPLPRYWKVELPPEAALQTKDPTPSSCAHPQCTARLPLRLTRFFGRTAEIAELRQSLLAPDIRLVTLTGSGGNGKTRLALETAEQLVESLAGNVWFVPLADITAASQIPTAIHTALRLPRHAAAEPLEQTVEFLAAHPALLVLDNFEHLLAAPETHDAAVGVSIVRALLQRVPSLTVLITSRQALDIGSERVFELRPLPTPNEVQKQQATAEGADLDTLLSNPGVRLFVDRAQSVKSDFQLIRHNAAAIVTLCDRLEGIPLALELAAARAQVMTPAQMLQELETPFDLLASWRKDLAPRHQTLFQAVDWSYRLLSPSLRAVFARLSIFRGGWTLEAARAVACLDRKTGVPDLSVLDYLAQLRHFSLILADEQGDAMRYRMLEMIRAFAAVQLAAPERADLQRRHTRTFLQLAEDAENHLTGPQQREWLHRMETEQDNFRAALQGAIENQETALAIQLGGALGHFWNVRGHLWEARAWFDRILALPNAATPTLHRARLLRWAGYFRGFLKKDSLQAQYYRESLEIYRAQGDTPGIITLLGYLGVYLFDKEQPEEAREHYEEAVALAGHTANMAVAGDALTGLFQIAYNQGDYETARPFLYQALEIARAQGDTRGIALTLRRLARTETDLHKKRALIEQTLPCFRELGDTLNIAMNLSQLAHIHIDFDECETACAYFTESIALLRAMQEKENLVVALAGLADAQIFLGELGAALQTLEEAMRLTHDISANYRGMVLSKKAWVLQRQGAVPEAAARLREALLLPGATGDPMTCNYFVLIGTGIVLAGNRPERAAILIGRLIAYFDRTPAFYSPTLQRQFGALVAQARAALPEAEYETAFAIGYASSAEEAVACALQALDSL